jgi:hypothetical protein
VANWFINARVRIWRPEVDKHGLGDLPRAVQPAKVPDTLP